MTGDLISDRAFWTFLAVVAAFVVGALIHAITQRRTIDELENENGQLRVWIVEAYVPRSAAPAEPDAPYDQEAGPNPRCHAATDGECYEPCPQLRDGEPVATGRHCPLDYDRHEL